MIKNTHYKDVYVGFNGGESNNETMKSKIPTSFNHIWKNYRIVKREDRYKIQTRYFLFLWEDLCKTIPMKHRSSLKRIHWFDSIDECKAVINGMKFQSKIENTSKDEIIEYL